jgi:hypothetical protein
MSIQTLKILKYDLILMGNGSSLSFEDYQGNFLDAPNAWVRVKPKNYDYYFTKKRCCKISRRLYKNDYDRGYLYGYYEKENPLDLEAEF